MCVMLSRSLDWQGIFLWMAPNQLIVDLWILILYFQHFSTQWMVFDCKFNESVFNRKQILFDKVKNVKSHLTD